MQTALLGALGAHALIYVGAAGLVIRRSLGHAHLKVTSAASTALWLTSFALCLALFELVALDILALLEPALRTALLRAVLAAISTCVLVLAPALQMALALSAATVPCGVLRRLAVAAVFGLVWAVYLALFWRVGVSLPITRRAAVVNWQALPAALRSMLSGTFSVAALSTALGSADATAVLDEAAARVALVGVALMAVLAGFGAAAAPYDAFFGPRRVPISEDIARLEARLHSVRGQLTSLAESSDTKAEDPNAGESTTSLISDTSRLAMRVVSAVSSEGRSTKTDALQDLQLELESDIAVLREEAASVASLSLVQRIMASRLAGATLAVYGTHRAFTSAMNILADRHEPAGDAVAAIFATAERLLPPGFLAGVDTSFWSRQLSLLLVAGIVLGGLVTLSGGIVRVMRAATPGARHGDVLAVGLAQAMASYCVATVLLVQSSVPPVSGSVISAVFSGVRVDFFGRWFDIVFLHSALAASIALYFISPPY